MGSATYPAAVRTFSEKTDNVTTVDASDVNSLQDEVVAIETTLGVNPAVYAPVGVPPTPYGSVAARLAAHEAYMAELENQINLLSFAAADGWSTPVLRLSQGGVTPPVINLLHGTGYAPVVWNTAPTQDPGHMWTPGSVLTCVLGGWYNLEYSLTAAVDWTTLNTVQASNNALGMVPIPLAMQRVIMQVAINGTVVSQDSSVMVWTNQAYGLPHNICAAYSGPLNQGDVITVLTGEYSGLVTATAGFAATFVRGLPGVD
jgi:hypothetical protein